MIKLTTPLTYEKIKNLKAGEFVYLSGEVYTARDAAHQRLVQAIENKEPLPFPIKNATLYYVGPAPKRENQIIGSCGPTTSTRMDNFTPQLLDLGLIAMIGKGKRNEVVLEKMKECKAIYLCGIGGAAAITAETVKSVEVICYEDLGTEAIHRLVVKDMPLIVGVDIEGNNLFERSFHGLK